MSEEPDQSPSANALLAERKFFEAAELLRNRLAENPSADDHGLLALALFQLENYAAAAQEYEKALALDGANVEWPEMLALARANAEAAIDVRVPEPTFFDRDQLLAPPREQLSALPQPLPARPKGLGARAALSASLARLRKPTGSGIWLSASPCAQSPHTHHWCAIFFGFTWSSAPA